ncbi:MAG: hypothetical protein ACTHJP_01680 [Rhodanobacteraceae bacterium]
MATSAVWTSSWVVTSYLRASTISTPPWGKLGDLYGRKRISAEVLQTDPMQLRRLPPALHAGFVEAYAAALQPVFFTAGIIGVAAFTCLADPRNGVAQPQARPIPATPMRCRAIARPLSNWSARCRCLRTGKTAPGSIAGWPRRPASTSIRFRPGC